MIALKLILFSVFLTNINCREFGRHISRGNARHRQEVEEYNYNHPPESENYEGIPVAVVYEDESSRKDKSFESDISGTNKVQQVNKGISKSELNVTLKSNFTVEESDINIDANLNKNMSSDLKAEISGEHELIPNSRPTAQANQEHQIPVQVVYEPESLYYKEVRPNSQRVVNKRRKVHRPTAEDKRVAPEAVLKRVASVTEEKRVGLTTVEKRISTTAEDEQVSPAAGEKVNTLAIEQKQADSVVEEKLYAPDVVRKHVVPAAEEKQVAAKEAINTENQNAYDITTIRYREIISSNSESKQPQQFPKRDNSTPRRKEVVPIVQSENLVFSHSGDFQYSYEGGDGTKAFEKGELKTYEDDKAGEAVSGGFSYTGKDGNEYSLTYTADENGYRPVGAHLPTPPPIPPAIARALAYLATKTTPEPVTESIKESDTFLDY